MAAGLLNYDQPDPLTLGLLGFSQAISAPRSRGGGVAAALSAFPAGQMQAADMRRRMEADELRKQMAQAQMQNYQSEAEQRKAIADARRAEMERAQAQAEAQRRVLLQFSGPPAGFRDASIAQTGNAPAGYTPPQQRSVQVTPQMVAEFAAAGGDPALLRAIAESGNFGRPKVAGTVRTTDAQGRPVSQMRDDYGGLIGNAMPEPYERKTLDIGGSVVDRDPFTGQQLSAIAKSMTPDGVASNQVALGNLGVAQANLGLSRERFAAEQRERASGGADGGFQYITTPTGIVAVPKKPGGDGPIAARPVLDSAGLPAGGANNTNAQQRTTDANEALAIITEAEKYIKDATGSFIGTGLDMGARAFGYSTTGAENTARLQAMEGMLVSKMPKMSGPQSDRDVQLYRQMAGQIGDPTIPTATKQAALETIKSLQRKYAGLPTEQQRTPPPSANDLQEAARRELARRASPRGGANGSF
jgi:hypothetical protein